MALKTIKQKIIAVGKTHKVTRAMEAVSAVKMRKSQERALSARPYALHAFSILHRVRGTLRDIEHPLLLPRALSRLLLVIVTSDKGLAGNLNSAVLKECDRVIDESKLLAGAIGAIVIGRKAFEYALRRNISIVHKMENVSDAVSVIDMNTASKIISDLYQRKEYDECLVVYTHFVSTIMHDVRVRKVLPVNEVALQKAVKWARPKTGRFAHEGEEVFESRIPDYVFEPSAEEVLHALVPHLLNIEVYHALLEAKASEHSARMIAMKNATERASEVSHDLKIIFNKERQGAITREVSEIVSGAEAAV